MPPYITHIGGRPSQEAQSLIVNQALANLRMPKAARALMAYYASCGMGFRPSLKLIDENTHIGVKNVSTVRQYLVHYGLIAYDGAAIYIDWMRLKAFAMMNPKLIGKKKNWQITPLDPVKSTKSQVHNYYMRPRKPEESLMIAYEAIGEAIKNGIRFPEMEEAA